MTDRVHEDSASVEDIRLGIMEDLITRYLAGEWDLRRLADWLCIWRLHFEWSPDYTGGWLRELTYHHLFLFARGTWPESTLRESLAFLRQEALTGECRWKTPMVDQQWLALLTAGNVPPGVTYQRHTEESVRRMTPDQRAELRRTLGMD